MSITRRQFVRKCGKTCMGLIGATSLLDACAPVKQVNATVKNRVITVAKAEFGVSGKKDRRSVLIRAAEIPAPIIVYSLGNGQYSALLLQCTHQGAELSVSGEILTCPAHGSEFDKFGGIIQGPAETNLSRYQVTTDPQSIHIHLT